MAADLNDSVSKTLTLTSSANQRFVSVTFPSRPDTYFSISAVAINGTALPKGTDFGKIDQDIERDDVITITVVYAPTTLPDPGEDLIRHQVMKVILNGPKVVNVSFHLYGVSYGICESCKTTIPASAEERYFTVDSLKIHISDSDAMPEEESDVDGTAKGEFVFYVDAVGGRIFLRGEDIPQFEVNTPSGKASASGIEGELFEGTYEEKDDGAHFTIYQVHISAPTASCPNLYTDFTTELISISDKDGSSYRDGKNDEKYGEYYNFDNVDGHFEADGVSDIDGELTMVGGVILPRAEVLQELEGAVLGFRFELSEVD